MTTDWIYSHPSNLIVFNFLALSTSTQQFSHQLAYDATLEALNDANMSFNDVDAIVCEGYLGKPKKFLPKRFILDQEIQTLENLYETFFTVLKPSLKKNTPIVICFPCFRDNQRYIFMEKLLDKIQKLGYDTVALSDTKRKSLIYDRKDQVVGREIFKFIAC